MKINVIIILVFLSCISLQAQDSSQYHSPDVIGKKILEYLENKRQDSNRNFLEKGATIELIKNRDHRYDIVESLGNLEDLNNIPELNEYIGITQIPIESALYALNKLVEGKKKKSLKDISGKAQVALAKLGDEGAYKEIISELNSAKHSAQRSALLKLGHIGDIESIRILGKYLGNTDYVPKKGETVIDEHGNPRILGIKLLPKSWHAAGGLKIVFPDVEIEDGPNFLSDWQSWWENNGWKYDPGMSKPETAMEESTIELAEATQELVIDVELSTSGQEPESVTEETTEEKSSNWLLWVILLIALTGVIAFVSRKQK